MMPKSVNLKTVKHLNMIKLTHQPLRHIFITQPFGVNYVDFYANLGLKGHNGIDLACNRNTPVFATHKGIITWAGKDTGGGVGVTIKGDGFKTVYYHLLSTSVKTGQTVDGGDLIGMSDNTGQYTTGDHLHFHLKRIDGRGNTINWDNGYRGAIDPSPYLPKNWNKPPVWHGYGQIKIGWGGRKLLAEIMASLIIQKEIGRIFPLMTKAYVYGDWSLEDLKNPSLQSRWIYLTKEQWLKGDDVDFTLRILIK